MSCGDNNACTTDSCNPATGCVNAAVSCDDNNSCTDDSCDPASGCVNTDNGSCNGLPGRMTGGGSVFGKGSQRVTHGFELHCDPEVGPNNLEVNWSGNHFHMEELLTASCPTIRRSTRRRRSIEGRIRPPLFFSGRSRLEKSGLVTAVTGNG